MVVDEIHEGSNAAAVNQAETPQQPTLTPGTIAFHARGRLLLGIDGESHFVPKGVHSVVLPPGDHTLSVAGAVNTPTSSVTITVGAGTVTQVSTKRLLDDDSKLQLVIDGQRDPSARVNVGRDIAVFITLLLMVALSFLFMHLK